MKIQGISGMTSPGMIDSIMESDRIPIDSAKQRQKRIAGDRNEFKTFDGLLDTFGKSLDGLKSKSSFTKLALESSHPELLEGSVSALAKPGTYEFEVEGLAKPHRELAFGFADADKTPVGFGFMRVGVAGNIKDVTIPPGATLRDVAERINDASSDVKAMVINTGQKDDPFRLLVSSVESGKDAVMSIDPDTTFTDFKGISNPQDLKMKFEGVDIQRNGNKLDDLLEGVSLRAKQAAPGTKVQVEIKQDIEKTSLGLKDFVKQYNDIATFSHTQNAVDPTTGKAGPLAGDSSLRTSVRQLQNNLSAIRVGAAGLTLADIGITTDPHSGNLNIDDAKLKDALSKDYEGVASVFANSDKGPGLAQRLSETIHQLRDRQTGAVALRMKGMDERIKQQEKSIAHQEERLGEKRKRIEQSFASFDAKMAGMQSTSELLGARFGNGGGTTEGPTQPRSEGSR